MDGFIRNPILVPMDGFIRNPILVPMDGFIRNLILVHMDKKIWKSYSCLWMEKSISHKHVYGWKNPKVNQVPMDVNIRNI